MSDLAEIIESSEPTPMFVKSWGVRYTVYPFSMLQVGKIQRAIKTLPCPYNTRTVRREMAAKLTAGEVTENEVASAVARCHEKETAWPPRLMEDSDAQDLLYFEEAVQVAMVRTALKLPDDQTARGVLEGMKPVDYLRMCLFCFQVGDDQPDPKVPISATIANGSTTSHSSPTSSPAPDGPESMSSTSPSPTSSAMLG